MGAYCIMAEFKSVVKDTKSNTKNITKSISIHDDYQGVHFLVSTFVAPFHHYGRFGNQSCYELQTNKQTNIQTNKSKQNKKTQSDVTNSLQQYFF